MNLDAFSKGFSERYAQLEKQADDSLPDPSAGLPPMAARKRLRQPYPTWMNNIPERLVASDYRKHPLKDPRTRLLGQDLVTGKTFPFNMRGGYEWEENRSPEMSLVRPDFDMQQAYAAGVENPAVQARMREDPAKSPKNVGAFAPSLSDAWAAVARARDDQMDQELGASRRMSSNPIPGMALSGVTGKPPARSLPNTPNYR